MSSRVAAVVPAAGRGTRMGGNIPKQFLTLGELPLLVYALRTLDAVNAIHDIIVVVPENDRGYCEENIVQAFDIKKVSRVVAGGQRRQDSVRNGLSRVGPSYDFILVHDGARPFVSAHIIEQAILTAFRVGGAVVAIPLPDTLKRVQSTGIVQETLNRDHLWLTQTPQVFRHSWLAEAHQMAEDTKMDATDDALLIEQLGYPVSVVEGSILNIKITRPEDLQLGEAILARQESCPSKP